MELFLRFQDVEFLSSRPSFSTAFLESCGGGGSFVTTTCAMFVVVVKQGHDVFVLANPFIVSIEFYGDHRTVTKIG